MDSGFSTFAVPSGFNSFWSLLTFFNLKNPSYKWIGMFMNKNLNTINTYKIEYNHDDNDYQNTNNNWNNYNPGWDWVVIFRLNKWCSLQWSLKNVHTHLYKWLTYWCCIVSITTTCLSDVTFYNFYCCICCEIPDLLGLLKKAMNSYQVLKSHPTKHTQHTHITVHHKNMYYVQHYANNKHTILYRVILA